jgi:hypothetical protein
MKIKKLVVDFLIDVLVCLKIINTAFNENALQNII